MNDSMKPFVAIFVISLVAATIMVAMNPERQRKVVTIGQRKPINWTDAGEAGGIRTGRSVRGFIKGLWKSGDGK